MDREILFKAKRLSDGAWIEGNLVSIPADADFMPGAYILPRLVSARADPPTKGIMLGGFFEVDPSTVCQYTGLTDRTGKKIFEGDKLRCYVPIYKLGQKTPVGERWLSGTVIWDESSREEPAYWALDADDENGNPATYTFSSKFEVIGSIHDGEGVQ